MVTREQGTGQNQTRNTRPPTVIVRRALGLVSRVRAITEVYAPRVDAVIQMVSHVMRHRYLPRETTCHERRGELVRSSRGKGVSADCQLTPARGELIALTGLLVDLIMLALGDS